MTENHIGNVILLSIIYSLIFMEAFRFGSQTAQMTDFRNGEQRFQFASHSPSEHEATRNHSFNRMKFMWCINGNWRLSIKIYSLSPDIGCSKIGLSSRFQFWILVDRWCGSMDVLEWSAIPYFLQKGRAPNCIIANSMNISFLLHYSAGWPLPIARHCICCSQEFLDLDKHRHRYRPRDTFGASGKWN